MMYASSSYAVWIHIHFFFAFLFLFAFAAGVVWLIRFANKESLKTILWVSLVVSILGLLLTSAIAYRGMDEMMSPMMEWMR
ncbi:hypothetical protein IPG41_05085 [Candidatus Peregrinibacteria bacterium]|nr:MAG: hypothetical protein IPG41_05085 [Candidatus Peregrinibacteria bacterium]